MQAAAKMLRGVAHDATRLRGQSMVEYVLLIAIIALVVVFAGPPVAGAIRNQLSAVAGTVDAGTNGGTGAGSGMSGGSDSGSTADLSSAVSKDAAVWTLDEQKAVADDIAKNGTASKVYAKAKAAMDAGSTWSVKLTNDKTMTYRIIGINHDDLADGSGKAGLTFEATNNVLGTQRVNATNTNVGGWEASELRGRLNSGDLWSLLPTELQSKVKSVTKMTDNQGGGSAGTPSATTDRVFLLSSTEVYGDLASDGTQYEYFKAKGVTNDNYSELLSGFDHWTRSVGMYSSANFYMVGRFGPWNSISAMNAIYVFPAFSF